MWNAIATCWSLVSTAKPKSLNSTPEELILVMLVLKYLQSLGYEKTIKRSLKKVKFNSYIKLYVKKKALKIQG
jgi:hypothetical protein